MSDSISQEKACALDVAVHTAANALSDAGFDHVDALFSLATGLGNLPTALDRSRQIPLSDVPGVPDLWRAQTLVAGEVRGLSVWMLGDPAGDPPVATGAPSGAVEAWTPGFPSWLAAAMGAHFNVIATAGIALDGGAERLGKLGIVQDHLNLSGRTPLIGLGGSHLGPLFPDLTDLHHEPLRRHALSHGEALGLPVTEVIAACTLGPTLLTPAERRYLAKTGANVAVQGLATPLLASAHAGLSALSIVAITDDGDRALDIRQIVARTEQLAPALDDLLLALSGEIATLSAELRESE